MSPIEAEYFCRIAQQALPAAQLPRELFEGVQRALPPPPADWWLTRLQQAMLEICPSRPLDPIEAMMAKHIVVMRHVAADMARRCLDGVATGSVAAQLRRNVKVLLRAAGKTELTLRQRQQAPVRRVPTTDHIDTETMDAVWCRTAATRTDRPTGSIPGTSLQEQRLPAAAAGAAHPVQGEAAAGSAAVGVVAAVLASAPTPAQLPDKRRSAPAPAPAPVAPAKFTLCGQRIDLVRLETMPAAGTA